METNKADLEIYEVVHLTQYLIRFPIIQELMHA